MKRIKPWDDKCLWYEALQWQLSVEEFCIWWHLSLCCEISITIWEMCLWEWSQVSKLLYSYHTKPKMWRTKISRKFCAGMAACPAPAWVLLPVSVWLCMCMCVCVYLCTYLFSTVRVHAPVLYVQLWPYRMCMQPCVSLIVLSGNDRVSTTVCERGGSRGKIAALQLPSVMTTVWWLYCHSSLHMERYCMNGTTTTELTNTAWQLEPKTTWWAFVFTKITTGFYVLNIHCPSNEKLLGSWSTVKALAVSSIGDNGFGYLKLFGIESSLQGLSTGWLLTKAQHILLCGQDEIEA